MNQHFISYFVWNFHSYWLLLLSVMQENLSGCFLTQCIDVIELFCEHWCLKREMLTTWQWHVPKRCLYVRRFLRSPLMFTKENSGNASWWVEMMYRMHFITCIPLYRGSICVVITHLDVCECLSVCKITHECVDGCWQNLVGIGKGWQSRGRLHQRYLNRQLVNV